MIHFILAKRKPRPSWIKVWIKAFCLGIWWYWFPPKIIIKNCDFTNLEEDGFHVLEPKGSNRGEFIDCKFTNE